MTLRRKCFLWRQAAEFWVSTKKAPQVGREPTTLRLTAGSNNDCLVLPGFASSCFLVLLHKKRMDLPFVSICRNLLRVASSCVLHLARIWQEFFSVCVSIPAVAPSNMFAVDCDLMISAETIEKAVRALVEGARPAKIILFGSYVRGDGREDSDIDLLVVEPNVNSKRNEMVRLRRLLRPFRIPVDLIVVSEKEFNDWGHLAGTILYWANTEGRVLHETSR